ncbi:MAG TPA: phosphoribosylformylglycinamidine cyclo-ligase [Planctomycetota bacterium]|nr:phosphoribosylformylglycinamidine cyclo-ligase [Planctomycetota bacterium]
MTDLSYGASGVDVVREEKALAGLVGWARKTFALRRNGEPGSSVLDIGYFANVVEIAPNLGLAVSADGVGTKLLVAQLADRYDTVGIDLVAMNVNDLICLGAEPVSLLDYLAVEDPDPRLLDEIGKGLYAGCEQARITLPGGELAQIGSMLKGAVPGRAFDVAGFVVGLVALDRINTGKDVRPGDVVVGFHSTGLHSNGYSLARKALLDKGGMKVGDRPPELGGKTLGDALLEPTRIYVRPVLELLKTKGLRIGALAHITGDGFLNMARIEAPMGFVLDKLPEPPAIFELVRKKGNVPIEELYLAFNMGIGFTVTVGPGDEKTVLDVARKHGYAAQKIGHVVADEKRRIRLPRVGLVGDADARQFSKE